MIAAACAQSEGAGSGVSSNAADRGSVKRKAESEAS